MQEINLEIIFAEEERELIVSKRRKRAPAPGSREQGNSVETFNLFSHF
jgi:hypothetical protein